MHRSYKEVKNVMHNEDGITKEEIREIIRDTVKFEVNKILTERYSDVTIQGMMDDLIKKWVKQGLGESWHSNYKNIVGNRLFAEVQDQVAKRLDISIKVKEE